MIERLLVLLLLLEKGLLHQGLLLQPLLLLLHSSSSSSFSRFLLRLFDQECAETDFFSCFVFYGGKGKGRRRQRSLWRKLRLWNPRRRDFTERREDGVLTFSLGLSRLTYQACVRCFFWHVWRVGLMHGGNSTDALSRPLACNKILVLYFGTHVEMFLAHSRGISSNEVLWIKFLSKRNRSTV